MWSASRTATAAASALALAGCGAAPAPPRIAGLECRPDATARAWVHVELFERGRVVLFPAGLGIAPPRRTDGAYVRGGRCRYEIWTEEPTGLFALTRPGLRLTDLFALWGRRLPRDAVVHVDGRRRRTDVALTHHAQIVVQIGRPRVVPHARYTFPPGR